MLTWNAHPSRAASLRLAVGLLALPFIFTHSACNDSPPTGGDDVGEDTKPTPPPGDYGGICSEDVPCSGDTRCMRYTDGVDDFFCTQICATDDDCPGDGDSSCLSVNQGGGLVQLCVPNTLCIDPDRDGYGSGPGCLGRDCDQSNPNIHPGAKEICDGLDNDCNELIDDNPVDVNLPCETNFLGVCSEGWTVCTGGTTTCEARILPGQRAEICDGLDNDCDGLIDEGASENIDETTSFVQGIGQPCGIEGSLCFGGYQYCDSELKRLVCDEPPVILDIPDLCDGIDNNCDGQIDEDANDPNKLLGTACAEGIGTCRGMGTWVCNPNDPAAEPVCTATSIPGNALPETCDYNDNNCDGIVDNGFVNDDGVYHTKNHCGGCDIDCDARWGGDPASFGVQTTCNVQGQTAQCSFTCLGDRVDLDKRSDNGCEFTPDPGAIYVAKGNRGGSDTNTCGDYNAPCETITRGMQRAAATNGKSRVRVSEGLFEESLTLTNGISLIGGHSARNWLLDPTLNTTTVRGSTLVDGKHVYTVLADGITSATEFSGFTVDAADAGPGGNSYGLLVRNSTAALTIKDNTVLAGRGGVGSNGATGTSGNSGGNGGNGLDRSNDNNSCSDSSSPPLLAGGSAGQSSCGSTVLSGGSGASVTQCPSTSSSHRAIGPNNGTAPSGQGTAPGAGGISTFHVYPSSMNAGNHLCIGPESGHATPIAGGTGAYGNHGSGGAGAPSSSQNGSIASAHWVGASGSAGNPGTNGSGGGGGGSSGGLYDNRSDGAPPTNPKVYHYGPTGGGGGGGGCGGTGGQGGQAGGGSFAIFVTFSSTANSVPSITGNTLSRGEGGQGGRGGQGGAGGAGGAGGEGGAMFVSTRWSRCGTNAARGGSGGGGGHAGGGGGGAGGASFDIAVHNAPGSLVNSYANTNTFLRDNATLTGGQGGQGGDSVVNSGLAGTRGASGTFIRF